MLQNLIEGWGNYQDTSQSSSGRISDLETFKVPCPDRNFEALLIVTMGDYW